MTHEHIGSPLASSYPTTCRMACSLTQIHFRMLSLAVSAFQQLYLLHHSQRG